MAQRKISEPGMHILAVIHYQKGISGIYDAHGFRLRNLAGDILELAYLSPAGSKPGQLIRDLAELHQLGYFAKMNLREQNGMLMITSISEPQASQDELRDFMPEAKRRILTR